MIGKTVNTVKKLIKSGTQDIQNTDVPCSEQNA